MIRNPVSVWSCFLLFLFLFPAWIQSQETLPFRIGDWRAYFPAGDYALLEKGDESVIVANFYQLVLYYPETEEKLILNKVNGLSQTGITAVKYMPDPGHIIVGYENGNIDIVTPQRTINMPGIRNNENILESKRINDIAVSGDQIFLATDFGVVEIDGSRYEFGSTLFTDDAVRQIVYHNTEDRLVAGSDSELYVLPIGGETNLADISQWNIYPPDQPGMIGDVVIWDEAVHLVISGKIYCMSQTGQTEEVRVTSSEVWHIRDANTHLLVTNEYSNIFTWDGTWAVQHIDLCLVGMRDVVMQDEGQFWYITKNRFGKYNTETCMPVSLPGVPSRFVSEMTVMDGALFVATGGVTRIFGYLFREDGFYTNAEGGWKEYSLHTVPELKERNMRDVYAVTADPATQKVYFGTFWDGLIEYQAGNIKIYDKDNSAIQPSLINPERTRITDLFLDKSENLWMSNHDAARPVVVKTREGDWYNFKISQNPAVQRLAVDEYENVWMVIGELGLLIYRPNDWETDRDDQSRLIIPQPGQGDGTSFDNARINEIAIDHQGAVWLGTESGPVVFDCGDFALEDICQGRKPVIEIDGKLGVLLRNENVKTIAFDAGNRKWLGTENGVYVVNNAVNAIDHHFRTDNSPLPHNSISDITIDYETGEVFIATDEGLVSYRGESTSPAPAEGYPIKVFPNPVPPGYDAQVGIQELPENALVRITNLAGRVVYENRAIGGQLVWDQRDQDGRRVGSGVYLVFATKDDSYSPFTQTGKIFILH